MRIISFIVVFFIFILGINAQINFSQSQLDFDVPGDVSANVDSGVTSLMYGPDGRLYVAEYPGAIKILTIQRNGPTDYVVTDIEELDGIQTMPDHNDDGTSHSSISRETLGLTVVGTTSNPIIYVTSSDFRIGAGSGGGNGDVGLDTNSGVITRFSWNGSSWDVVDLVRGLPRSEENHATNGLEFVTINNNDYLIVASGGHTNAGAPSENFVLTCEYALSAAVLSVDLTALEALPILNDNGRSYVYDLPTLDDPTRENVNGITDPDVPGYDGIDINDPWGGNDGLNQAIIVPDGPVQIFSPGYRNAYDLVVTENGALYVTDNGANGGWGGFPENEGGGSVTNDYNSSEPGSSSSSGGEAVNNEDHLQLVTLDIETYEVGSLYGGHPNPIRANPTGAGLYTDNESDLGDFGSPVFRTLIYDPSNPGPGFTDNPNIALPANWSQIVPEANPDEGDWRGPGMSNPDGDDDNPVTIWGTNTNGIDEYTASNFGGVMKGNLLAGVNSGTLRRVELDDNGGLVDLTSSFLSGIGGNALGVTCNSDSDIFPGTIWAGTLNGKIVVFEPQDFVFCLDPSDPSYDPLVDYDFDGYTNEDEDQNGTDLCNGGSQPTDFDKSSGGTLISDLNDTDDDFDGIPDSMDPFQLGDHTQPGSDAFTLPISNALFNDQQGLGGIFGLGMTGLMNNGDTGANWLNLIDDRDNGPNPNDVLGGAPGIMTSHMTSGTALGTTNTQEKGYQYGVQVDNSTGVFTVTGGMNGFFGPLRLFGNTQGITNGELGIFIGDGTQSNYIKFVVTIDGFTALQEIGDVPQDPITSVFLEGSPDISEIQFHFVVDPATGQVDLEYQINGGLRVLHGTITAQGSILTALQDPSVDLAVGFIGTSGTDGLELEGSWDFLNVVQEEPFTVLELPDIVRQTNAPSETLDLNEFFGDNGGTANLVYTVQNNSSSSVGASISANELLLSFGADPTIATIVIRATDQDNLFVEQTFQVELSSSLYRINAGGPEIMFNDELFSADANFINGKTFENTSASVSPLFQTERSASPPTFEYAFSVPNGEYEVVLYFAEIFFGATGGGSGGVGDRVFDVDGEGIKLLDDYDIFADVGPQTEVSKSFQVGVSDGELNLVFDATGGDGVDQPKVSAIEILNVVQFPDVVVNPIADQNNDVGDEISTLGVQVSGGNPSANFTFAISGEPDGIFIEPTNGLIFGTIEPTAVVGGLSQNGTHQVEVTISKPGSDPVQISFNWIITGPPLPFTMEVIASQETSIGAVISLPVNATGGDVNQPITYSISGQPLGLNIDEATGEINGVIDATALTGGPNNDGLHQVTVTADRAGSTSVQQQFLWVISNISCTWNDLADSNISRFQSRSELIGDKIYVMGGWLPGINSSTDLDIYDITNDTWSLGADLPEPLTHMANVTVGHKIWLLGGFVGNLGNPTLLTDKVRIYNTLTDSWSTGPDLPKPIGSGSAAINNNKIHFIGGLEPDIQTDLADHYILDLDNISAGWVAAAPMPRPRNHHSTESINGIVYTIGGQVGHATGSKTDITYLESYDPSTNQWTILADLPIARSHFESGSLVHNGKIIIVGGQEESSNFSDDVTEYDPITNTWSELCSLPYNLMSPMAQVYQNRLIVSGGGINGTGNLIPTTQWLQLAPGSDFTVNKLADQVNQTGEDIGSLQVEATGGNPILDFSYSITGQPSGITIDPASGIISGIVDPSALIGGPNSNGLHLVTVTVSKSGSNDTQLEFTWNITDLVWQVKGEVENYSIRHECSFVHVGDKFTLLGGRESADVDVFDYNLGVWNPAVSAAPIILNHFQGVYYQGYIWAIGALVGTSFPNDPAADHVWLYETTTNQWIQGPEIPEARKRGSTGLVMRNNKFYLIGGNTLGHNGGFVPWFDEYDPETGIWSTLVDAPNARDHFQATLIGDKIYVIGGAQTDQPTSNYVAEVDVYDFTTGTWSTLFNKDLPTPRDGASIAVFNDDIVVIGGGDADVIIDGVIEKGTREITEGFDVATETWYKMPDMNFGRRSTQAIVSGDGIHILAGQSSDGPTIIGNMEYYGEDNPIGNPIVASTFSVPNLVTVASDGNSNFNIEVIDGDTGIFINSMQITGTNASDFSISAGEITNGFLSAGSSRTLNIALSGIGDNRTASLVINYNNSQTAVVSLTNSPLISPLDQSSLIGDVIALPIEVIDNANNYTFTAANLPEGLAIDALTGIISGTVTGSVLNSPYTSRVAIVDILTSLEVSFVNFQWEVIDPTIIVLQEIPDQSNFTGDTVLFSASATGGDEAFPMVYSINGLPLGITINSATGEIAGIIDPSADSGGPNNDGVYIVTVTASRQGTSDVVTQFSWTVIEEIIDLPWIEDFEDLADGTTVDTGVTAWSTNIDQGVLEVDGGTLLLSSVEGGSTAFWNSEPISITGHENVTISIDVDDLDSTKEISDFVTVYYQLDGGALIPFGTLTGDIELTTFTVSGITGTVLELVAETQVSWSGETYSIDNVNVSGTPTNSIAVSSVTISPSALTLEIGGTAQQLTASVNPINADDTSVSWSSSDESIATVDQNGFVTPIGIGIATITVTTTDGGFEAESVITVIEAVVIPVTGITLSPPNATMLLGDTPLQLVATILPADAGNQNIIWTSSDDSIASINSSGAVIANAVGSATITATTVDGGFTAESLITVNPVVIPVTGISLSPPSATMLLGDAPLPLLATILPADADNQNILWTSSDNTIATVDQNGFVTAIALGTASITATTVDGGFTAESLITVDPVVIPVTGISLSPPSATMLLGDAPLPLLATILPADADNQDILWSSSDESIATVDQNGFVTAIALGTASITATTVDGGFTAESLITVNPVVIPVTGISLSPPSATMLLGDAPLPLLATILPADADNQDILWSSSDESIATVDQNGLVTAIALGTASITATTVDGGFTAESLITVDPVVIPVTGISLSPPSATMLLGDAPLPLLATILPSDADNQDILWTSSDDTIATVDQNGLVTAIALGTASITATTVDGGFTAESLITVDPVVIPVTGISLSPPSATMLLGDAPLPLLATILPADADNQNILWTSSDESIATVDQNGLVTAIALGIASITATTVDGGFTAESLITIDPVVIPVTGISLSPPSATMLLGDAPLPLLATILPADADNQNILWTSSDNTIATVDQNGFVTAIALGTASITATTVDGGFTAESLITVDPVVIPVTGISLSPPSATMLLGDAPLPLLATILPADADNQNILWTSSDESIATVDQNGLVTAIALGIASITATTVDGGFTAESLITIDPVVIPVTGISLSPPSATMLLGDAPLPLLATILPADADNQNILWTSSDNTIATVDQNGFVTAIALGTASITATTVDGGFTAESLITIDAVVIPVTGISLSPPSTTMLLGDTPLPLLATILPADADNQNILWTSSDESIATVDQNGLVTAIALGIASITATTVDGGFTAESLITIDPVVIPVTGISLSPPSATMLLGDAPLPLLATILPADADNQNILWTSSDNTIATVDQNGFVTAIALGTASITATTVDGGFTAESLITVNPVVIPVTGISLSPPSATMLLGDAPLPLLATIIPSDASDQGVLWSSSDSSVASVNANGEVIANTVGIALITATSADGGFVASSTINVIAAPIDLPWIEDFQDLADGSTVDTGVTAWTTAIDQGDLEVNGGLLLLTSVEGGSTAFWNSEPISIIGHDNVTISIDVDDLDSTKESNDFVTVYYKLDGGSLIPFGTVNGNIGLTTLTVSGLSGTVLELVVETQVSWSGETYTIDNVNVSGTPTNPIAVSSVTLSPSTLMVEMGDTSQQLTATVNPINADDTSVTWSSSDETIVTVDQNGFVTPIALGTATITVTTTDGGFEAESLVTVIEEVIIPVTGISLNPPSAIMNIGGSPLQLVATILPSDASDQGVLWSSSDNSVASVNANGEVMANTEGAAVVTATSADGGFVASSTIKVIAAPIDLPWIEDFEDLADGSTVDTGVTAWTTAIDQGNLEVNGGLLLLTSVSGGSTAFWNSEAISITGHDNVTISIDVDDLDSTKESNDFVTVYYKLDGGALIPFGTVNGNIGLTTLTVSGLMGTVLELVVETQVSASGETYTIDNVNVSGTPTNPIAVSSVTLSPSTLTVEMGDTSQQLIATVNPINADDTSVTWSSSDETIVTVDQNGFVTPIALGTATITVTTTDGGFEAESLVTVIEEVIIPVTGITLSPPSATMNIGGSPLQLVATILPSDASDQGVLWSSSDNSVASVNANGEVIANTEGAAVITATSADGGFVASSTITVLEALSDLPWFEDFEDLADGTTQDTGVTAWSTSIDEGVLNVDDGLLLLTSVNGGSTAFWNSEAISIVGHDNVTISIDVNDLDSTKESNDFVTVYYKLDGGALIPFGTVNGNIGLTTLTVSGLMGTVLELVIETQVSWSGETYTIDNVNVSDIIAQKALIPSTAIVQETSKDDYIIYPNPTSQVLNIRTSANHSIDFIQVFDATGRLVRTYNKNVIPQGSTNIQLGLDGLEGGMYSLHIIDSQTNRFVKKLIVN